MVWLPNRRQYVMSMAKILASAGNYVPVGEQLYTSAGTYTFTVPDGVYSVSIICIGAGAGGGNNDLDTNGGGAGGAGGLSYRNDYSVTPSSTLSVTVGASGAGATGSYNSGTDGGDSYVS